MDTVKPRKKRKRQESIFTTDFGNAWKAQGGYWYKIPDVGGALARFAKPRPYDVLEAFEGKAIVIEVKHCKTVFFGLSEMREHQIPELLAAQEAGFHAFVLVVYDRLKNQAADIFRVNTLVEAQKVDRQHLRPEDAESRFYSIRRGEWVIDPRAVKKLLAGKIEKPCLFSKSE